MPRRPKLGQHFLASEGVARRIVELVPPGAAVVEIGPGRGALTTGLVERAGSYLGVELDDQLADRLAERLGERDGFRLVKGDFLAFTPPAELGEELTLVGNVPYAVSARIVQRAVAEPRYRRAVLMFQREFARRLTAGAGESDYGSLSVYVDYHWRTRIALHVPAGRFRPPPRVDSAVIVAERREVPPIEVDDPEALFTLVRACFARRRKQLANADRRGLGVDRETWLTALEAADIPRNARAQELALADFARLLSILKQPTVDNHEA
ncbi:MAG: ribosomal RNA small subunit methyltransferase A [Candidatus Coatesbacteria bacterium]|nr:ribosomal RNA small subunit methyltransferase A [Candidatus Coatesbacteria bacterium]